VSGGELERYLGRLDPGADRDHPGDACCTSAGEQLADRLLAPVEVSVGIDHAVAGASIRGKSGCAASIPLVATVLP